MQTTSRLIIIIFKKDVLA